jgi:hypothetical protein
MGRAAGTLLGGANPAVPGARDTAGITHGGRGQWGPASAATGEPDGLGGPQEEISYA